MDNKIFTIQSYTRILEEKPENGEEKLGIGVIAVYPSPTDKNGNIKPKQLIKIGDGSTKLSELAFAGGSENILDVAVTSNEAVRRIYVDNIDPVEENIINSSSGMAVGVGNVINTPQGTAIGTMNVIGATGYYWDNIDYANKTITITNERKQEIEGEKLTPADISSWEIGDIISLVNHHKYTGRMVITEIDPDTGTIVVDNISPYCETIKYPYVDEDDQPILNEDGSIYYDAADERTICAFYREKQADTENTYWACRPGSVSINAFSTALGAYNLVTGSCALATGYKNWQSCDYGIVAGVGNKSQYASLTAGGSNDVGEYCLAAGRWNKGPEAFDYILAGEKNNLTGTMGLTVGAENTVAANFSIVGGYGNVSSNTNGGTKHIINGMNNKVDGQNNIVSGLNNITTTADNCVVLGHHNNISHSNNVVGGDTNTISGFGNLVAGQGNNSTGSLGIITGGNNTVNTNFSIISGYSNKSNGGTKHIINGQNNTASAKNNLITGENNLVAGDHSVVFGLGNTLSASTPDKAQCSAVIGNNITMASNYTLAVGKDHTIPEGKNYCLIAGSTNTPSANCQLLSGIGNVGPANWCATILGRYADTTKNGLLFVGNGDAGNKTSNALYLDESGNLAVRSVNIKVNPVGDWDLVPYSLYKALEDRVHALENFFNAVTDVAIHGQ